jgi:hypothetical protein
VLRSSGFKFRDEWASIITGMPFWLSCIVLASCAVSLCGSCFACDFVRDNGESLRM